MKDLFKELIAEMRRLPHVEPLPTAVVPPELLARIRANVDPTFSRKTAISIYGVPIVSRHELDGFDEWLLVPHGRSVDLEVAMYLLRKSREPMRQTGRMHGLREAAMEVES